MKTLVIHDNEGKVVFTNTNIEVKEGEFSPLIVTIPEGKMLIGVNIETGEPIFSDIPKSEIQTFKEEMENVVMELSMIISMGGME